MKRIVGVGAALVDLLVNVQDSWIQENKENIPKFGITFTKHIGNAVTRNKLKRRIKSIIDNNPNIYQNNQTYIIIAKQTTLELNYQELEKQLIYLFSKIKGEKND